MRPPANTATFGVAFAIVNLGLLAYMGAPLPPQPYLSMLVVFLVNLLLFAYTPVLVRLLGGSHEPAAYRALDGSTRQASSVNSELATRRIVLRTRICIYIFNWFTIMVRGSFKDGQYTTEYHNDGFILPMILTGIIGGPFCVILWFAAFTEAQATPPQPINESNEDPAVAHEGREDIQLGHTAASWDKAADKV